MSIRVRIAVGVVSFFGFVLVVVLLFYAIAPGGKRLPFHSLVLDSATLRGSESRR
jgi:hypothetical protein